MNYATASFSCSMFFEYPYERESKDFLMAVTAIQTTINTGKCPHGMPLGACPLCNGMGGGGTKKNTPIETKTNEWSYAKCYAVWMRMQADEARLEYNQALRERQLEQINKMSQQFNHMLVQMKNVLATIHSAMPEPLKNVVSVIANNIARPLVTIFSKIPQLKNQLTQIIENLKAQILATTEKLSGLLGEIKQFIEKRLYEQFKQISKKFLKLFIWSNDSELNENEEELEKFKSSELRKIRLTILKLKPKKRKKKDDKCSDNKE